MLRLAGHPIEGPSGKGTQQSRITSKTTIITAAVAVGVFAAGGTASHTGSTTAGGSSPATALVGNNGADG
jgi:hypothetical protein